MHGDSVIADVGETLIKLLQENMGEFISNAEEIALLSLGDDVGTNIRLSLCLYNIVENPYLKNQEFINALSITQVKNPPLVLELYYLLTAHPSSNNNANVTVRTLDEHRILGRAMRVFHDFGIVSGSIFQGSLSKSNEQLRITLNPMPLTDLTGIWNAMPNQKFRPLVSYVVTPVTLDSTRVTETKRVVIRDIQYSQSEGDSWQS